MLGRSDSGRDLDRAAIWEVSTRLGQRYRPKTFTVRGKVRFSIIRWSQTEGIEVDDDLTYIFEPVRRKRIFGSQWQELQPVEVAASKVGWFLRGRDGVNGNEFEENSS